MYQLTSTKRKQTLSLICAGVLLSANTAFGLVIKTSNEEENYDINKENDSKIEYAMEENKEGKLDTIKKAEKQSKSGFTLGLEMDLGKTSLTTKENPYNDSSMQVVGEEKQYSNFSFNGGINLGYQHYFDKEALGVKQAYGISTNLYFGVGIPNNNTLEYTQIVKNFGSQTFNYETSFLPIKLGFELSFLWDFLEKEEHTLGLTAGFGYRMSYFKSLKNTNNAQTIGNVKGNIVKGDIFNQTLNDMFSHNIYPLIGLHYYYGKHQFSLNLRLDFWNLNNQTKQDTSTQDGAVWNETFYYDTNINSQDYLSIGYSYRF